jgi:hypothetical protein
MFKSLAVLWLIPVSCDQKGFVAMLGATNTTLMGLAMAVNWNIQSSIKITFFIYIK